MLFVWVVCDLLQLVLSLQSFATSAPTARKSSQRSTPSMRGRYEPSEQSTKMHALFLFIWIVNTLFPIRTHVYKKEKQVAKLIHPMFEGSVPAHIRNDMRICTDVQITDCGHIQNDHGNLRLMSVSIEFFRYFLCVFSVRCNHYGCHLRCYKYFRH